MGVNVAVFIVVVFFFRLGEVLLGVEWGGGDTCMRLT